jgi:RNA polymerase sigma factor (sigma-70 family)
MSPLLSHAILGAQSDERLVELAREGHERAFEALVERYRKPLHRHVRKLLPEGRAEDAVQQAFINAWTALQRGVEVREPRPWLYRVAQNAALNALRVQGYEYDELQESLRSHAAGPEEDHERRWVMRRTLAGLAALPEAQREALLRTAVEGRSQEQVAAELGLTEGAVRGLVYRARTALRAAATALTPSPLLGWAVAFASGGGPSSTTERIAEIAAGGGTASAGAVLAKAGAVVAVTGALASGAVAVREEVGDGGRDGPAAAKADAVSSRALGGAGLAGGPGLGRGAGPGDDRGGHGRGQGHGRGRGRDRGTGDDHGRSGKGRGRHGSLGEGKTENGADDHGTSGSSGSGSGEDRSGPSGTDDRRGTSGSGSGSSGSGSADDHSGSGSSGPGPGADSGSSGGGSVSSGPSDGGTSGSGVSGSGSAGGSSGEGSSGTGSVTTTTTTTMTTTTVTSSGSGSSGSGSSGSGSSGSGTSQTSGTGSSSGGSDGR